MTGIMSPAAFEVEIKSCIRALLDLNHEYAGAHSRAYSSQTADVAKVTTSTGFSSEPYALHAAHKNLRGELRFANEWLRLVMYGKPGNPRAEPPEPKVFGVFNQVDALRSRMESDAYRPGIEDAGQGPVTAYKADVEEAVEAQGDRRKLGDAHTGDHEEVRERLGLPTLEEEFRPKRGAR